MHINPYLLTFGCISFGIGQIYSPPVASCNSFLAFSAISGFCNTLIDANARAPEAAFTPFNAIDVLPCATICQVCGEVPKAVVAIVIEPLELHNLSPQHQ